MFGFGLFGGGSSRGLPEGLVSYIIASGGSFFAKRGPELLRPTSGLVCDGNGELTDELPVHDGLGVWVGPAYTREVGQPTPDGYPEIPEGTTSASMAGSSGGNGLSVEMDTELLGCFTGSPTTIIVGVTMGVGDNFGGANYGIVTVINNATGLLYYNGTNRIARSYDGTSSASPASPVWSSREVHYKIVQVSTGGLQFRVGNLRKDIDTEIQWSSWVTYDGSFSPISHIRFAYGNTVPMWLIGYAQYNLAIDDDTIISTITKMKPPVVQYEDQLLSEMTLEELDNLTLEDLDNMLL